MNTFGLESLRRAVLEGDIENGSIMAGQSVGMVTREQPTREVIDELLTQAKQSLLSRSYLTQESIRIMLNLASLMP